MVIEIIFYIIPFDDPSQRLLSISMHFILVTRKRNAYMLLRNDQIYIYDEDALLDVNGINYPESEWVMTSL